MDDVLRATRASLESGLERLERSRDAESQRMQRLEGILEAISAAVHSSARPAGRRSSRASQGSTSPKLKQGRNTPSGELLAEPLREPEGVGARPHGGLQDRFQDGRDDLTAQGSKSEASAQSEEKPRTEKSLQGRALGYTRQNSGIPQHNRLVFCTAMDLQALRPRVPDSAISQKIMYQSHASSELLMMPSLAAATKTQRLMVHPDSCTRTAFDVLGLGACLVDTVLVPLDFAFDLEFTGVVEMIAWLTFVFWLLDMVLGFFQGYHSKGRVIVDPRTVVTKYLRNGFLPNLTIVCLDALTLAIAYGDRTGLRTSYGKLLRLLRLPRGVRAIHRLLVVGSEVSQTAERIFGAYFTISISFIRFFVFLAFLTHALACTWVVVGESAIEDHFMKPAACHVDLLSSGSLPEQESMYTTAIYWVMNLLLAGNIVISPITASQQFFLLLNLVIGLLFCSLVIGVISDKLVAFRMSQISRRNRIGVLRQYLLQSHVPYFPAVMMEKIASGSMIQARERVIEEDVELLRCLPASLRDALRSTVFRPAVCNQSFVRACEVLEGGVVENICRLALEQNLLDPGQFAFERGDESLGAYMVYWGNCEYMGLVEEVLDSGQRRRRVDEEEVVQCQWLCELAVFCRVVHDGSMRATVLTELLMLGGAKLVAILQQSERLARLAAEYAASVCRAIEQHPADFVSELALPVKHEQVVQFMHKDQRARMSEAGLEIVKRSEASWTKVGHRKDLKALLGEVANGKCDLLVQTNLRSWAEPLEERVLRVVCLSVLHLTDEIGRVLMQIGRFSDGRVVPAVRLPGAKILAEETPVQAIQRMMDGPLASIKSLVSFQCRTVSEEVCESKSFSIRTKYVKHVASASIESDWASSCPHQELELPALDQSLGLRAFILEQARDSTPVFAWMDVALPTFAESVELSMQVMPSIRSSDVKLNETMTSKAYIHRLPSPIFD